MNDDDDTGGGTLVIQPGPPGPSAHPRSSGQPQAGVPSSHGDMAPTPTQVLPITDLPSTASAPLPAAGRPPTPMPAAGRPPEGHGSFRPAMTLPIPPSALPPSGLGHPQAPRFDSQPPGAQSGQPFSHPGSQGPGYSQPPPPQLRPSTAAPLVEGPTVVPRKSATGTVLALAGLVALIGLGIAGTLWMLARERASDTAESSDDAPKDPATASTSTTSTAKPAAPPPSTTPTLATSSATAATTPPPPEPPPPTAQQGPEAEALAALEKLRAAVDHCTKNGTHVLPGTSPPIPANFAKLKAGPYTPVARDFDSSFFHCSQLRFDKPMSFAIQWQLDEPSWRGTGVVWIDTNADGEIDKAYSFYAQLKKKDEVQFAPPQRLEDPKKRVLIPR